MLNGKHIILGITGSIAAYKAAQLIRLFVKEGAEVKVIMTPLAKEFITPVTLATLSRNTVLCDFFHHDDGAWNSHVDLGIWADLFIVAPVSANTLAKMAHGIADNLLLTTYLSCRCPVMVAPAMDMDMFNHTATQQNIQILESRGVQTVEPASGELASGLIGKGRMEEPEEILVKVKDFFSSKKKLKGKRVLVTAGPTIEPIDAVRFISNYSSGKMGYKIADELAAKGAEVILVSGRTPQVIKHDSIKLVSVQTAAQMTEACLNEFSSCDVAILAAAVADYTPASVAPNKLKKTEKQLTIELKPTVDIAKRLGELKKDNQVLIGFALETDNEIENAQKKLKSKNFDFIVLNSLNHDGAGFETETNRISIISKDNNIENFELKSKAKVASDIVNKLISLYEI